MRSTDSLRDRHWTAWRPSGGFTKNPDVVRLPSSRLLCVYNQTDVHWPTTSQITLLQSDDDGRTWKQKQVIDTGDKSQGEEVWITPRISRLRDGRLIICCDQNDFAHCHEDSPPGIYVWWSEDDGESWSERQPTEIPGIEPDRVVELSDGTLVMGTHFTSRETVRLTEALAFSHDRGRTWGDLVSTGKDTLHNFCEGAYLELMDGTLLCVMRENSSAAAGGREFNLYPSFVAYSLDRGRTWTQPVEAPFWGDRPFAGLLSSGQLLVTYRNVGSRFGLYAWLGDPYAALRSGFQPALRQLGGPVIDLLQGTLRISAAAGQTAQYSLLPPEDFRSSVTLTTTLRVAEGGSSAPAGSIALARSGYTIRFFSDRVQINTGARLIERASLDGTRFHQYRIEADRGRFRLVVDGEVRLQHLYNVEATRARAAFGSAQEDSGTVEWRSIAYHVRNESQPEHFWAWSAAGGLPNQHEHEHILEIEAHVTQEGWRDLGYSSWVELPDGRIFIADYTNNGGDEDPSSPTRKAYIRGTYLYESDFRDAPAQA